LAVKVKFVTTLNCNTEGNCAPATRLYARIKVCRGGPAESMNVKWQYFVRKETER